MMNVVKKLLILFCLFTIMCELYAQKQCEKFEWKCENGDECIAQDELCDGRADCKDGTDETAAECVNLRCPSYAFRCAYGACINNNLKCNGKKDCADNSDETPDKCHEAPTSAYCSNAPLNSVTIKAACDLNGRTISCDQPLEVGARAKISCREFYNKPKDRVVQDILVCDSNGEWDNYPFRCEQTCGVDPVLNESSLTSSDAVNNTLVPWHVSIFSSRKSQGYEQICGGSIINAKVVISAAHCFWNIKNDKAYDKSVFRVAAGKYFRNYDAPEPLPIQTFAVEDVHIKPSYKDVLKYYIDDLAVVILEEPIIFNTYIYPICIEWQSYEFQHIQSNIEGKTASWQKIEGGSNSGNELRAAGLTTLSNNDCIEQTDLEYRDLVTDDKFCVSTKHNGINVGVGDSGSGFAIPKIVNGVKTYFLWGVISNGILKSDNNQTAVTNIQFFKDMIATLQIKYRPK